VKRYVLPIRFSVLFLLILLAGLPGSAIAQGTVTWGEPFNVSNSPTSSSHPAIVADAYGYIHVFWSEDANGREIAPDELGDPPNTILYRRWDGQAWTEPLEILAVADDALADYVAATVDGKNQLHLVWTGLTNLYYSTAPAAIAYSARAWSTPQVIAPDSARTGFESDVAVDAQDNVHVVYATKGSAAGVYHTMTPPDSAVWSAPVRISGYLRPTEIAFTGVRLAIDATNRLHTAWGTGNTNGYAQAVYYARSERLGEAWDASVMLADATIDNGFTGFPSLLPLGQDELLLIHVDERYQGRIERTSGDGGKSWSEPHLILSSMVGVNGFMVPLLDGGGALHLVINMRPSADQRTGIYYAPRAGLDWSPIVPVAVDEPSGPSAHYTDATVRLGNEIHIVWTQLHGGEIWHVRGQIQGVPASPALAFPTPASGARLQAAPTTAAVSSSAGPTPARAGPAPAQTYRTPVSSLQPLLIGILPAALLVLGAVLWATVRSRR